MAQLMQVKESLKLRQIMQTILTLGNALNQGTARGTIGMGLLCFTPWDLTVPLTQEWIWTIYPLEGFNICVACIEGVNHGSKVPVK